ncbi:hypothetical protein BDW42DRAFT_173831 [Aspergillus taichungensis]|uniref:Uncharacterized protein n=1 Tax=Aspergillus taichungensis TaxID=482145 RepID=A0A2J5HPI7_9EURO|nr:hypothetical protein BDW42DRAFT_173831 [Aspergillus taichungensis]
MPFTTILLLLHQSHTMPKPRPIQEQLEALSHLAEGVMRVGNKRAKQAESHQQGTTFPLEACHSPTSRSVAFQTDLSLTTKASVTSQ